MGLNLVSHPILKHKLTLLRDKSTKSSEFRQLVKDISHILAIEASRDLDLIPVIGTSPISSFEGHQLAHRIGISPILRAGIGMTEPLLSIFPSASVFYLGLFREKVSLQPVEYYQKLPPSPTVDTCYLLDPLVATGGTASAAVEMLLDWGLPITSIKMLVLLGSRQGLEKVMKQFPGLEIYVGGIDEILTEQGMISPGLGDSGDRMFATI